MLQARAFPARIGSAVTFDPAAMGGAEGYVAGLKAKLAITEAQAEAWAAFAETLSANARRMQTIDDSGSRPFGRLPDRLAALRSMRHAAARLFPALSAAQQRSAMHLRSVRAGREPVRALPYEQRAKYNAKVVDY